MLRPLRRREGIDGGTGEEWRGGGILRQLVLTFT